MLKYIFIFLLVLNFVGCVGNPPILEYNLAKKAMTSAKEHSSKKFASGLYYKANKAYQRAKEHYNSREYEEATEYFNIAISSAEKAELKARVKKQKLGEVF